MENENMIDKSSHCERSEVMAMGEVSNTSPQPSPRGEGAVVGEHKANHTNSGEVKKAAFTLLVKHFRSNPLTALLRSRRSRFSQTKYRNCVAHSYGFTLAETMIVLVVLGIVAALMIPSLMRKQAETQNRTKLKKAMTTYEKAFNQMLLDNQLTTNNAILSWADGANVQCENTSAYYRKEDGSGCLFKNSGLWWYIGEDEKKIEKVLISTKKIDDNDPNQTLEKVREYAKDKKNMTAFYMTGYIDDNGILRINDKAGANEEDKADIKKLYAFTVNWMYLVNNNNEGDPEGDDPTGDEDNCPTTTSCDEDWCTIKDCHGNNITEAWNCSDPTDITSCNYIYVNIYDGENPTAHGFDCNNLTNILSCNNIQVYIYNGDYRTASGNYCSDPADITSCNSCHGETCESLGFTNCSSEYCCKTGSHFDEYSSMCVPDS